MKLVQIDFPYHGPYGDEMATGCADLAKSIAQEPGLLWKIWNENRETGEAGGIYLFVDEATASAYLKMHTARLEKMGFRNIRSRMFDVNEKLSEATRATFCRVQAAQKAS